MLLLLSPAARRIRFLSLVLGAMTCATLTNQEALAATGSSNSGAAAVVSVIIGPYEMIDVCVTAKDKHGNDYRCINQDGSIRNPAMTAGTKNELREKAEAFCKAKETAELKNCKVDGDISFPLTHYLLRCRGNNPGDKPASVCTDINFSCKCDKQTTTGVNEADIRLEGVTLSSGDMADLYELFSTELLRVEP